MSLSPVEAVLIGAGQRGADVYGAYARQHPGQLCFVAVAEPDPARRARFAAQHKIPTGRQFTSWEPLLSGALLGQAALVCTQDWQHTAPTLAALRAGYHVLLEKPMATTAPECRQLVNASAEAGRQLHIAHVLRYTPHFRKMRKILQSGVLGQIINVSHRENVSWWHMAHSYVRGHWRDSTQTSPMILAKCCHDFDLLLWLLDRKCLSLSSVGGLLHFRAENTPPGVPDHCLDGCPVSETCPYYAPFIYIDLLPLWRSFADAATGLPKLVAGVNARAPGLIRALGALSPALRAVSHYRGWPRSVVALDPTPENLREALRKGPYGRCVFHCDNNVVDHQVVAMGFEGGLSATLTMHGHSHVEGRDTRIEGSRGELRAHFGLGGAWIEVCEHRSGRRVRYANGAGLGTGQRAGHGGGDAGLLAAFVRAVRAGETGLSITASQALESHLLAFAAEAARLESRVVQQAEWMQG